jgi:hypothetical protein
MEVHDFLKANPGATEDKINEEEKKYQPSSLRIKTPRTEIEDIEMKSESSSSGEGSIVEIQEESS